MHPVPLSSLRLDPRGANHLAPARSLPSEKLFVGGRRHGAKRLHPEPVGEIHARAAFFAQRGRGRHVEEAAALFSTTRGLPARVLNAAPV